MYRRTKTRPPRAIEETAAMQEAAELRHSLALLADRNSALRESLRIRDLELDKLLLEKILLCRDIQSLQRRINFLEGRDGLGHEPWDIRRIF